MAVNEALRFAFASLCFERAWNLMKFGIAIAARMPMIATTIISSIRVKPRLAYLRIMSAPWVLVVGYDRDADCKCGTTANDAAKYARLRGLGNKSNLPTR